MESTPAEAGSLDLHERVQELLEEGRAGEVHALLERMLEDLHGSDVADLVEWLDDLEHQIALMRALPQDVASEALAEMEEGDQRADLLAALTTERGAELLQGMADDDAVDLIAELDPEDRARLLSRLPMQDAGDLEGLLLYGEETAGGRMTTSLVSVPGTLTAAEAIEEVRKQGREVEDFYSVFVVDPQRRLLGTVPLDDLIVAELGATVESLVQPSLASVLPDVDQEDVGRLMARYNMVSLPVVNAHGQLLGRITVDDVLDVMEAEQTEDILLLAGVSDEEEIRGDWHDAVRARLPWLALNLITASVAASVVLVFAETIESLWFLAAIMPIVAAMGGNSGTQALAVTVRRIATTAGPLERKTEAVGKEAVVGLVNGLALGLLAALVAFVAVQVNGDLSPRLPVVVLFAMWGTIVVAGFGGAFIPTVLDRLGVDPAVASSVFVTTLTDLFGFFLLLGLATALLL